eukprot:TRINITY_DN2583_c0_g1_i1.p1 TRINITY_DN2583_c0_g1~~TRINITY_DN2583_c0_g1_i1.p1  ORF type:complete len:288 (-),score=54.96 TRINITY_DN2583_c0_g1_i1:475-1338(-)
MLKQLFRSSVLSASKLKGFSTTVSATPATATITPEKKATTTHSTPSHSVDRESWNLSHPIWTEEYVKSVGVTHRPCQTVTDYLALGTIKLIRTGFDLITLYPFVPMTAKRFLTRMIFLETVAAIPGTVAASARMLQSCRKMKRDYGFFHTLVEEAENERMHLMTALKLREPGKMFRVAVTLTQFGFLGFYKLTYAISPIFCHRLVGYLEEEAVRTYTKCIDHIEKGHFWKDTPAPYVAIRYWQLKPNATMHDVILHIRADEVHHREVNHDFANVLPDNKPNPYFPGQ